MKKFALIIIIFCLITNLLNSQTNTLSQRKIGGIYYKVSGLVYFNKFDVNNDAQLNTKKANLFPLNFGVVSVKKDTHQKAYYVINFLEICDSLTNSNVDSQINSDIDSQIKKQIESQRQKTNGADSPVTPFGKYNYPDSNDLKTNISELKNSILELKKKISNLKDDILSEIQKDKNISNIKVNENSSKVGNINNETVFINSKDNGNYFWIYKDKFDSLVIDGNIKKYYTTWLYGNDIDYGANVSLPFKLRPSINETNIKISPELSLGGYLGWKWRVNSKKDYFLTAPLITVGLSTLAINDNTTTQSVKNGDGTVLGVTYSTGAVLSLENFQIGMLIGGDRAGGQLGKEWLYNDRIWYSFSIGFSFFGGSGSNSNDQTKIIKSDQK